MWPGFAGAGIAGSAFLLLEKTLARSSGAAVRASASWEVTTTAKHSRTALESTIEVRLSNGRSLIVPPEFEANHLRALLVMVESES